MQFGHDEMGVLGYLVNSGGNSHEAVSPECQPRTELLRCEPNRVLAVPQREDRPVPNCHPDSNDFPEPHPTTALGSLWYRHTIWPRMSVSIEYPLHLPRCCWYPDALSPHAGSPDAPLTQGFSWQRSWPRARSDGPWSKAVP